MKIVHIKEKPFNEIPDENINVIEIKVSECNLDCVNCSDVEYRENNWKKYSVDSILQEISGFNTQNVLISGGEPLMYFETPILCNALYSIDKNVILKTNGTGPLENIPAQTVKIINYKLGGSGEKDSFFFENLLHIQENDFLKFEILNGNDLEESLKVTDKLAPANVVFTFIFDIKTDNNAHFKKIESFFKAYPELKYFIYP